MKRTISFILVLVMCLCLCACDEGNNTEINSDEIAEEKHNPFVIDGVYLSVASCADPSRYNLTIDEYFDRNPHLNEELDNNDDVTIFVFASLHSLESGEENLILLPKEYKSMIPGYVLPLTLRIGEDFIYNTSYEVNDNDDKISKFWKDYKSGTNLDDDYVLYEGSGDSQKIVGMFYIKYYDYKKAVEEDKEITLVWGEYEATITGSKIVEKRCTEEISQDLKRRGLI